MEDSNIKCPVCCDRTFDSKSTLLEHLINILKNLYCPICDNKQATLVHLVDHLTQNDCQKEKEELKEFSVILQDQTDNIKNEHFEVLTSGKRILHVKTYYCVPLLIKHFIFLV